MADRWENYRHKASEAVNKIIDATQRFTKIGRIRVDIMSLKREIDHQFNLLGKHVYDLAQENKLSTLADDGIVKAAVTKVNELKAQIAEKEAQIEELRKPRVEEKVEEKPEEAAAEAPAAEPATAEQPEEKPAEEPQKQEAPQEPEPTAPKKGQRGKGKAQSQE